MPVKFRAHTKTGYIEFHDKAKALEISANVEEIEYEEPEPIDHEKEQERAKALAALDASDKGMARVAEGVIGVLIAKGLLTVDDLPETVTAKLSERDALRKALK